MTNIPLGLIAAKRLRREEANKEVELNRWFLSTRQKALAAAMYRRERGEQPCPGDDETLTEAGQMPWFYGLDGPADELSAQNLVSLINRQGGFGSNVRLIAPSSTRGPSR